MRFFLQNAKPHTVPGVQTEQQVGHLRNDDVTVLTLQKHVLESIFSECVAAILFVNGPDVARDRRCDRSVLVAESGKRQKCSFVCEQARKREGKVEES